MLRAIFFGTPQFSVPFLQALHNDKEIEVIAIVTQPDKPAGRKGELQAPPIAQFAQANNIPLYQPERIRKNAEMIDTLRDLQADVFVVVAYGLILPETVLSIPRLGCVNVHPSRLPQYRGPSPMQAAIAHGNTETAITIMQMDVEMDHGAILAQQSIPIGPHDTYPVLAESVMHHGPQLLVSTLHAYASGDIAPQEQDHTKATYCKLLTREDGYVRQTDFVAELYNRYRAFQPWPGITLHIQGKAFKLLEMRPSSVELSQQNQYSGSPHLTEHDGELFLKLTDGYIVIKRIQPENSKPLTASEFLNGYRAFLG